VTIQVQLSVVSSSYDIVVYVEKAQWQKGKINGKMST